MSAEASGSTLTKRSRGRSPRRARIAISLERSTLSWLAVAAAAALGGMFGGGFWLGRALAPAMAEVAPGSFGAGNDGSEVSRARGSAADATRARGAPAAAEPAGGGDSASAALLAHERPASGEVGQQRAVANGDPASAAALERPATDEVGQRNAAASGDPVSAAALERPASAEVGQHKGAPALGLEQPASAEDGQDREASVSDDPTARIDSAAGGAADVQALPTVVLTEAPKRGHGLQVGAFEDEDEARRFIQDHAAQLGGLPVYLVTSRIEGKGVWHRVRLGQFDDRAAAGQAKGRLGGQLAEDAIVVGY